VEVNRDFADETQADAKRILQKINPTESSSLSKLRWQVLM